MDLKGVWLGVKASIIASSCCTLPLLLVLMFSTAGAGSMTAALKIPRYKFVFIAVGTLFLLFSIYYAIKARCQGSCKIKDVKTQRNIVIISIATYIILTLFIIYLILPAISTLIFS